MIIGKFLFDEERNSYSGFIRTLTISRDNVELRPLDKAGENGPDYRIVEDGPAGLTELGAAWRRNSEKGQAFLSILLDDPVLGQSLNLALFDGQDGSASLVWTRPRAPVADVPQKPAARSAKSATPARRPRLG